MQNQEWMSDHRLDAIDHEKKDFIGTLFFEMNSLSEEEKLPFIMALLSSGRLGKVAFTSDEMSLLLSVLKDYADEEHIARLKTMMQFMR